ncbi:unnamed protein product [Didymodactylos carnosus]|uniref:Nudix hydrolase domain-containing protein n=1 Tax=Didymodactylos carnosus TaxID=1234261 RepID=A0A8S2GF83_9BILA|nr:unnamed protein product [Didymodactylos carnosus]CAF3508323.1 unnamed protein product [Didymodactylos carnosus]
MNDGDNCGVDLLREPSYVVYDIRLVNEQNGQRKQIQNYFRYRNANYQKNERYPVTDDKVAWNVRWPEYFPTEYTTEKILKNKKADPADVTKIKNFNCLEGKVDRTSFTGIYQLDEKQRPKNPMGRTGLTGRGRLYYWGPNHAGDPVVTRWLRDSNGESIWRKDENGGLKKVLEIVAIQRKDNKEFALPGGMVDPGEKAFSTLIREFKEEAMNSLGTSNSLKTSCDSIEKLFENGEEISKGYVDDPRNTDNAWMESTAWHFHDETGKLTKNLTLTAGDDATKVAWTPVDRHVKLYASHTNFVKLAVDRLNAYW